MRALSWKQPYASLMLHGKIETRTWNTKYRGLVLICASKVPYSLDATLGICGRRQHDRIVKIFLENGYRLSEYCGHAIAVGELVDSQPMEFCDSNKCFVEYHPDLYCHVYKNVRAIKPIPWKGTQGWKKLDQEFINQIEYL